MNRHLHYATLLAAIAAIAHASQLQSQSVTQTVTISTVSMDYADLLRIVQRTRTFVAQSSPDSARVYSDVLTVTDGLLSVSASGPAIDSLRTLAPKKATHIDYRLSQSAAQIDAVTIDLGDWSRSVRVSGSSPEQVEALSALLRRDLEAHRTFLSGPKLRMLAGLLLLVGSVLWLFLLGSQAKWMHLGSVLLAQIVVYLPPWEHWLAGTSVYSESASIATRHSGTISLVGLFLAVVSVIQGSRRSPPQAPPPPASADAL